MLAVTAIRARHKGVASSDRLIAAVIAAHAAADALLHGLRPAPARRAGGVAGRRKPATRGWTPAGKRLFWGWSAIYVWLFVNAPVAASIHISLIVPALSIMAVAQCMRVLRPRSVRAARSDPESPMDRAVSRIGFNFYGRTRGITLNQILAHPESLRPAFDPHAPAGFSTTRRGEVAR